MTTVQLTALQMTSQPDPQQNLKHIEDLLGDLPAARPQLVVLPEACLCFGASDKRQRELAEVKGEGDMQSALSELARRFNIWLVAGTVPIINHTDDDKFQAASLVFNPAGKCVAQYNKIHLFDVDVADNTKSYRESKWTVPGTQVVTVPTDFGMLGLAVCYDVRFPELFRELRQQGADILVLPAAFTKVTGRAHWHVLARARAIEQQCALVAGAQVGTHANGRETYGHALVINGWGEVIAECDGQQTNTMASASWQRESLNSIRQNIPVAEHFKHTQKVVNDSSKQGQ